MGIFIRTLVITLVFCLGYFAWVYFAKEGYSPQLKITDEAKNVVVQEPSPLDKGDADSGDNDTPAGNEAESPKSYDIKIAMLTNDGNIKYVIRKAPHETLYTAISLLMKGPLKDEIDNGIFTEIPSAARLISVKKTVQKSGREAIIINLTKEFADGGGTQSIQARISQIVKTADLYAGNLPVYLYLDGKEAQYVGGEGIFIEQPINK